MVSTENRGRNNSYRSEGNQDRVLVVFSWPVTSSVWTFISVHYTSLYLQGFSIRRAIGRRDLDLYRKTFVTLYLLWFLFALLWIQMWRPPTFQHEAADGEISKCYSCCGTVIIFLRENNFYWIRTAIEFQIYRFSYTSYLIWVAPSGFLRKKVLRGQNWLLQSVLFGNMFSYRGLNYFSSFTEKYNLLRKQIQVQFKKIMEYEGNNKM